MTSHVKIHGVVPRIQYTANGSLTKFTFPFAIFSTDDIEVYLNDTKQASTAYTVTGVRDSDGGSVTFTSTPTNGTVVTIVRNLSIERTSDFQEGGALRADTLNDEFDYQIACQQQIADNLNRSMVLPPYAVDSNVNLTLPTPSAGKAIVWNADGTNLENSTVEVNALENTIKGYKESAESAAAMATTKAGLASDKADIATTQAQTAMTQAGIATTQAGIATTKATEVSTALSTKANKDMDNITSTGRSTVVNWTMPGYYSKPRVVLTSGVWNYAEKNILVTANTGPNVQGGIFLSEDGGVTPHDCIYCVAPSTGGIAGCCAFIRKGIYYKAVGTSICLYDVLMGE